MTAAVALSRTTSLSHTPVQLNHAFAQPISAMAPADTTIPPITHAYAPKTEPSLVLSQPQIQSTTSCIHSPIATASASPIASSVDLQYLFPSHHWRSWSYILHRHSGRDSGRDKQLCRRNHGSRCICIMEGYYM